MKKLWIIALLLVVSCGTFPTTQEQQEQEQEQQEKQALQDKVDAATEENSVVDALKLTGYTTPFEVSVDGITYEDSEEYYTNEVSRLQDEAPEGYHIQFNAQVGLRDMQYGLVASVVSKGGFGYAGTQNVYNGNFEFDLPIEVVEGSIFLIHVSKRVSLTLTSETEDTQHWCYNFYTKQDVAIDGQPLILREWQTKLTKYKCEASKSGISLPVLPPTAVKEAFEVECGYLNWHECNDKPTTNNEGY